MDVYEGRVRVPHYRTGLPQSVPRLQARRRARFAGSFVFSDRCKAGQPSAVRLPPARCPAAVAVGADNFALLDLGEDRVPSRVGELGADRELLVTEMIEL